MSKKENTTAPAIVRTASGLRDALFDEIDALRSGASNPTRANAVAKMASTVIDSVRMEIEVERHVNSGKGQTAIAETRSVAGQMALGSPA